MVLYLTYILMHMYVHTLAVPSRTATTCVVCGPMALSTVAPWLSAIFQRRCVRGSAGAPDTGITPLNTMRTPCNTRKRTLARKSAAALMTSS